MPERIHRPPDQPTPVADDINVSASPVLLERAAADYAHAQDRREQLSREDRVHGSVIGGTR
ncbi:hypothetical protein [Streptomyces chartreusis]|uniref:hypothetical protein n=1 Tax=Streptomyces chartreusis TaxID=1969 RepID=UPI003815EBDB